MEQIRQIPYGVSDFRSVREDNLYYVDKSMYIKALEDQPWTLFFVRPRRFGKSLFINMMRLYYDKLEAGHFEKLFGDLYIGQHGYCDFFLLPNLTHYQSKHSYILEIKYLPKKDFETKAEQQWQEAVTQIEGYASAPRVKALRQGTELHRIVMQFCGWELARMEEV